METTRETLLQRLIWLEKLPANRVRFNEFLEEHKDVADELRVWLLDSHQLQSFAEVHKKRLTIRNEIMDKIISSFPVGTPGFRIAAAVESTLLGLTNQDVELVNAIADDLSQRVSQVRKEGETIAALMDMLGLADQSQLKVNHMGVNGGYIVTDNKGTRRFVKNFANEGQTRGKIDPNELLVYKTLEHMGLGPETQFLIRNYSHGHGTAIGGNFIATKDVCSDAGTAFFLDDSDHRDIFLEALSTDRQANVELSVLSAVNDILQLGDTFGENPHNYGLVQTVTDGAVVNTFVAVDHLPFCKNVQFPPARFAAGEPYSPRTSIQKRVDSPRYERRDQEVAIHGQRGENLSPIASGRVAFDTDGLRAAVKVRVAELASCVQRAHVDALSLVGDHPRSFADDAIARLAAYVDVIMANIPVFEAAY